MGKGGLLQPVGDMVSKEGVNRAERGGKDSDGSYGGQASAVVDPVAKNAQSAGNSVWSGAQSAAGSVTGMFGGGNKEGEAKK